MDRIQELQTVIAKSELAQTDVDELIADFGEAVEAAAQWEEQAKSLEVTSEDQTDLMQKARMARLELREKRLAVTKKHKELKQIIDDSVDVAEKFFEFHMKETLCGN